MKQKAEEIYHRFVNYEWNDVSEGLKKSILEAIETALIDDLHFKLRTIFFDKMKEHWVGDDMIHMDYVSDAFDETILLFLHDNEIGDVIGDVKKVIKCEEVK